MDFSPKQRTVTSILRDVSTGEYSLKFKIQRKEGQWSPSSKKTLIDSIIRSYPVDPIRCIQENGQKFIVDGIQRVTDIRDFVEGKFPLEKTAKPVTIRGVEYEIAGKRFAKLDEEIQERITAYEMTVYTFSDCTYEDYCEIFKRQNNGKPLSTTQKRTVFESERMADTLVELIEHDVFTKIMTSAHIKADYDKDVIRQVLMFISDYEVVSLKAAEIDKFSIYFSENYDEESVSLVEKALDTLDELIPEKVKIAKLAIPIVLYGMCLVLKQDKSVKSYVNWMKGFIEEYDSKEDFTQYCKTGTANPDKVTGRLNYIESIVNSL